MLRLGAAHVVAFDNDPDAYAALRENAIRNDLHPSLFIGGVESLRNATFDIATMNIIPEVIFAILPQLKTRELIVSGVLTERRDEVVAAMRDYEMVDERTKGEWWAGRGVMRPGC